MRVLWFSVTPSLYNTERNSHNGGGWIESLERIVKYYNDVELAIAFCSNSSSEPFKALQNGTTYYPMNVQRSWWQQQKDKYSSKDQDAAIISHCLEVIADFKPDLIHVFGSEWCFGLVKEHTNIPVVIHMQGCWPPYRNAAYPPGYSLMETRLRMLARPSRLINSILDYHKSKERAIREEHILRINDYYMGRTRWDKAITTGLYNLQANYYYCSEALRPAIVQEKRRWTSTGMDKLTIVTVGAGHVLKGYDVVLKTAKLLTENLNRPFEWLLCGPTSANMKMFEKKSGIRCKDVFVHPLGRCSADGVKDNLLKSTVYVHTSYIDNSPNSVCEAQYLGLPVIATNVGGTPSLFADDYPSDMLVPTNDPYYLAAKLIELSNNKALLASMAEKNLHVANNRHDVENIYQDLMHCYNSIINNQQ